MNKVATSIAGLALGVLVLLIPVLIAPIPPIGDYPNHLARMWLLSSPAAQESMAAFYRVQFDTVTNIAIDLLALTLGKLAGFMAAGRVSIGLAVVLPPLGGALLWWSVHWRVHWWMLSFGLLAWGAIMINGFLNYQIAIGLALAFAALEPAIERRPWVLQVLARAVPCVLLLLAHPFGLLFYALLLAALAVGPRLAWREWPRVLRQIAPAAVSVLLVAALFVIFVPSLPGAQEKSGLLTMPAELIQGFRDFAKAPVRKVVNVLFGLRAYSNAVDGLTLLILLAPVGLALASRRLQVHAGLLLLSGGLAVAYFACPSALLGAGWVDGRFASMMAFTLAAAVAPTLPGWVGAAAGGLLALGVVGRAVHVADVWHAREADLVSLARALEPVPAGATMMTVEQRSGNRGSAPRGRYTSAGENSFRHLPALAIPWRHAYVPTLFSARGKQPVITVPPWDTLSEPNAGFLNDVHVLDEVAPVAVEAGTLGYITQWRKFDYLLVLNGDVPDEYGPFTPPPVLSLVRDAGFARLYRIAH